MWLYIHITGPQQRMSGWELKWAGTNMEAMEDCFLLICSL